MSLGIPDRHQITKKLAYDSILYSLIMFEVDWTEWAIGRQTLTDFTQWNLYSVVQPIIFQLHWGLCRVLRWVLWFSSRSSYYAYAALSGLKQIFTWID